MKRTHLNLALLVVAAGLGAAVYFGQKKAEKDLPLTALTAETLTNIALEHPGQPKVVLQKQSGQWKLVEPVQADTDPFEVSALLGLATVAAKRKLPVGEVQLAELGLAPPAYRIRLNDVALDFGSIDPIEARRYILNGVEVALVDDPPSTPLDADYSDLVAKSLVPEGAEIAKIELQGFSVARAVDGKAWSVLPAQPQASADAARKLAETWKGARAMWMAAEPAEGSHGERVKLTLQDGREITYVVAEREPQLVLARPDLKVRYTMSKALEAELLQLAQPAPRPVPPPVPKPTAS